MQSDFAGKNGFVWFTGIVENRLGDPLKMGRIQVRIFGWHDENRTVCPTEDLPWAQLLLPINANKSFSLPREGEWVFGFFLDGEAGQMPVVSGVYTGLVSEATMSILSDEQTSSTQTTNNGTEGDGGAGGPSAAAEDAKSFVSTKTSSSPTNAFDSIPKPSIVPKLPKPPSARLVEEQLGLPTIAKMSREVIENTAIAFTNNARSFFCSSEGYVAKSMAFIKSQIRLAAIAIREGFKLLLKALGFSASAGGMLETIKTITRYIKELNELISTIKDWVNLIKVVIKRIKAFIKGLQDLIEALKKLPGQLLLQIKRCLQKALKELKRTLMEEFKESIPEDVTDLLDEASKLRQNMEELITAIDQAATEATGTPIIRNTNSEFYSLSTTLSSGIQSTTTVLTGNRETLNDPNTALASTYIFDGTGEVGAANVNPEILTLGEMEPREREQLVYNIFPDSQRFSFSSVKLA